jgi:hypothetical protein
MDKYTLFIIIVGFFFSLAFELFLNTKEPLNLDLENLLKL